MAAADSSEFKLITAVLPMETDALGVIDGLRSELGVLAADLHLGRGASHRSSARFGVQLGDSLEKKILTVAVPAEQAEAVFAYVHDRAEIGQARGGLIYQQPLSRSTVYRLPDLAEE